jgi:actin-like protein 6A
MPEVARWAHDGGDGRYILKKGVIKNQLAGDALTAYTAREIATKHKATVKPHYCLEKKPVPGDNEGYEVKDISGSLQGVTASYHDWMVGDVVRDVKEAFCRASELRYDPEMFANKPPVSYELPDGHTIEASSCPFHSRRMQHATPSPSPRCWQVGPERYLIPELMLQPELGDDAIKAASVSDELRRSTGLIDMIGESINRCDADIRRDLLSNLVLTGGSSLFPGLNERIYQELALKVSQQKVKVIAPHLAIERRFSAWIGGSILASLGTFHQLWMSKKEYEESGASLVEKRCP